LSLTDAGWIEVNPDAFELPGLFGGCGDVGILVGAREFLSVFFKTEGYVGYVFFDGEVEGLFGNRIDH